MNSSGTVESMQSRMAVVHNLLAPLTERFSLRIRTPPRTVPRTANGIPTPPDGEKSRGHTLRSHLVLTVVC